MILMILVEEMEVLAAQENKKKYNMPRTNKSTGIKGVSYHKATGKYEVKVNVKDNTKRHTYYVGLYPTIGSAVEGRINFITNLV